MRWGIPTIYPAAPPLMGIANKSDKRPTCSLHPSYRLRAGRQRHRKAAAAVGVVAGVAAVAAGDLPHQREAEPGALGAGASRNAVEAREQLLARVGIDRRPVIGDAQLRQAISSLDGDLDRRLAMEL